MVQLEHQKRFTRVQQTPGEWITKKDLVIMSDYITCSCPVCGIQYLANPTRLKLGRETTCSRICSYKLRSQKLSHPLVTEITSICQECGKDFSGKPYQIKGRRFCSKDCSKLNQHKRVTKTCERCNKDFTVQSYRAEQAKYCSVDCTHPPHFVKCDTCGDTFKVPPSGINPHNFCSKKCLHVWQAGRPSPSKKHVWVHCATCGKDIERAEWQLVSPNQYCCKKCFYKAHKSNMSGDKNPAWRGGFFPYYGANWDDQRAAALLRDGYTCQQCNLKQSDSKRSFHIHHIQPLRLFDGDYLRANQLENLITLCPTCHTKTEWQTGQRGGGE